MYFDFWVFAFFRRRFVFQAKLFSNSNLIGGVTMSNQGLFSRRQVIKTGILAAASLPLAGLRLAIAKEPAPWRGLIVGIASYTLRKMSLDDAIKAIQRLGLNYVSIKDFHLPLKST